MQAHTQNGHPAHRTGRIDSCAASEPDRSFSREVRAKRGFFDEAAQYVPQKRLIQSRVRGPAQLMLGLPEGFSMSVLPIGDDDDLLYEFRHVLFYTDGVSFTSHLQNVKTH